MNLELQGNELRQLGGAQFKTNFAKWCGHLPLRRAVKTTFATFLLSGVSRITSPSTGRPFADPLSHGLTNPALGVELKLGVCETKPA